MRSTSLFQARSMTPTGRGMAVPAEGDLPDLLGDMPDAAAAGRKKDHVAGAEAADFALLVGDENLAGDDVQGFVDRCNST